jgi:hypothetical protein
MNTILNLENIGGNLITKEYYKFINDNMCDLNDGDYNKLITNQNKINLTFPLGLNGIISPVYSYTNNNKFTVRTLINILNEYYNSELTQEEKDILIEQTEEDLSIYSLRIDLLDYSNLCYFQGIENSQEVYNILLGS